MLKALMPALEEGNRNKVELWFRSDVASWQHVPLSLYCIIYLSAKVISTVLDGLSFKVATGQIYLTNPAGLDWSLLFIFTLMMYVMIIKPWGFREFNHFQYTLMGTSTKQAPTCVRQHRGCRKFSVSVYVECNFIVVCLANKGWREWIIRCLSRENIFI